ncbi:16832_t:CDS:2 [Funneliformis mosseae]|uniref:16832_t:CDS:1 n=1 Tax=Funneliformis mosseae TaxID=27381 RepID=A0A9N8V4M4_FUNMO|nr:16832_t:CDS:2 [Funneliformis mosseae]
MALSFGQTQNGEEAMVTVPTNWEFSGLGTFGTELGIGNILERRPG